MSSQIDSEHVEETTETASRSVVSKLVKVGLILAFVTGFLIALLVAFHDNLFRWSINPQTPYQTYTPPFPPNYSDETSWALRPQTPPQGAWETPWGIDVFYVHPTTHYSRSEWNAPIDDTTAHTRLLHAGIPNHARPFSSAGPIYAPYYRQATLLTELNYGDDPQNALRTAYSDVLVAFDQYMKHDNKGRGIILAGSGQGALHVQRLLKDRFASAADRDALIAVYVIDWAFPVDQFDNDLNWLKPCETADMIHCVVSWGVVDDGDNKEAHRFKDRSKTWTSDGRIQPISGRRSLCVNPLLWNTSSDFAPKRIHRGGANASGLENDAEPAILPGAVSTQCVEGILVVDRPSEAQLRRKLTFGSKFKTTKYNLFYADIATNAALRAQTGSTWLEENASKPAPPLPPMRSIEIAPINKVSDPEVNPSAALRDAQDVD